MANFNEQVAFRNVRQANDFVCSIPGVSETLILGTNALMAAGFELDEMPDDVDILITIENDTAKTILTKIQETYIGSVNNDYEHKPYVFLIHQLPKDIRINIWITDNIDQEFIEREGIRYALVKDVFSNKMKYNRVKDYAHLNRIVAKLLSYGS